MESVFTDDMNEIRIIHTCQKIVNSFVRENKTIKPFAASSFYFKRENNKIYLCLDDMKLERISREKYIDYLFDEDLTIKENKISNPLYFTSFGLISEEDFFFAEDTLNNLGKLKMKDLKENHIYLGNNGLEYIYIGKVPLLILVKEGEKLIKKYIETKPLFYVSYGYHDDLGEIKIKNIVKEIGINKEDIEISPLFKSISDFVSERYYLVQPNYTASKKIKFVNYPQTFFGSLMTHYTDRETIYDFVESNEKEYQLIRKHNPIMKNRDKVIDEFYSKDKKMKIKKCVDRNNNEYLIGEIVG